MTRDVNAEDANTASRRAEAALLTSISEGDVQAMTQLIQLHSELVYSVAYRVIRDASTAEDVMQEVFLQIWRKPASFVASKGSIRGYLAVMARNRAIDVLRQHRPMVPVDDLPLVSADNPSRNAEHNVTLERVRAAMENLPEEQKNALDMAFFGGCTHVEIARMTGSPLGTIKSRLRGALQAIGKALRP